MDKIIEDLCYFNRCVCFKIIYSESSDNGKFIFDNLALINKIAEMEFFMTHLNK